MDEIKSEKLEVRSETNVTPHSSLLTNLGLPNSTRVKKPLPKTQLFKQFDWKPSQRDSFDGDVARLDFTNYIAPRTLPAIPVGEEVKEIFVVEVTLKNRNFDPKNIALLGKTIPQRIVYLLRYGDEAKLAVYHTKLFTTPWQLLTSHSLLLTINGLNLDAVWENIVSSIGNMEVAEGNTLTEQIKVDAERTKILKQIETLERQMRSTSQPRRQREIYCEIKKLKSLL